MYAVLVDDLEPVGFRLVEINELDMNCRSIRVLSGQIKPLVQNPEGFTVADIERRGMNVFDLVDTSLKLAGCEIGFRILVCKETFEVVF